VPECGAKIAEEYGGRIIEVQHPSDVVADPIGVSKFGCQYLD
jgi:DNA-directed RNA polymerase subunit N (RpoN/RPB10)